MAGPRRDFFFLYPYDVLGLPDPWPEFEGRRVFVHGELAGDPLEREMMRDYALTVTP